MAADQIKKYNDSIIYNIGRLYVLLDAYLNNKAYKEFGLNPATFNLLMVIKHIGRDEGVSQIEAGKRLFVSAANITKLVDSLQKKLLIVRLPAPADRRVNLIKITEKGSRLLDRVWARHAGVLNTLLEGFSEKEKGEFSAFIERFKKEMERDGI